jgi:hypothetical protein
MLNFSSVPCLAANFFATLSIQRCKRLEKMPSSENGGRSAVSTVTRPHSQDPLPADPVGQRLCEVFGRYRWSFIQAIAPTDAKTKPEWKTEKRYPIKSRVLWQQWQDAAQLIGVRFDDITVYALIDIDINSPYHPRQNPESLSVIQAALETIGIARTVIVRSSWSGGLHIYIPLSEAVSTFNLSVAIKQCLEAQELEIKAGQLEIFPNDKAYGVVCKIEYRAHRLPLQPGSGSHLLDADLNASSNQLNHFFVAWDSAARGQDLVALRSALAIARENRHKRVKPRKLGNVEAWRTDLETTLAQGWTGHGQTNHLLKEMGCYGVVFMELSGEALLSFMYEQVITSPGYRQWCRHQQEIKMRVRVWGRAVERYYWPLGSHPKPRPEGANDIVPFNQRRAAAAQERIRAAVAELEAANALPEQTTQRAVVIAHLARTSHSTLYQNKGLWHPEIYPVAKQPVIDEAPGAVVKEKAATTVPTKRPEPMPDNELQTKGKIMKCKAQPLDTSFKKKDKSSPSLRGVRGEHLSFPQPEPPVLRPAPSSSPPRLKQPQSVSAKPTPGIDAEQDEIIKSVQRQVRSLNWTVEQISEFIAARFDGKRRSQLSHDELILLLYHLQTLSSEP